MVISELLDYEEICGIPSSKIQEITIEEFKRLKKSEEEFQLIDVREPHEFTAKNLGGKLIPLGQILAQADKISKSKKVIIHCKSGARSARAIELLQSEKSFENLWNLKGGIDAF